MLILILINVRYSQKVVLSFQKGSNRQNHSSSGSFYWVKKFHHSKISDSSHHLTAPNFMPPFMLHYEETIYFLRETLGTH